MNHDYDHQEGYESFPFGSDPNRNDPPSIDELLRDVKAQLGDNQESFDPYGADPMPAYSVYSEEYGQEPPVAPEPPVVPQEPEFEPDFGNVFQDYGSYSQEQIPPEELQYDGMVRDLPYPEEERDPEDYDEEFDEDEDDEYYDEDDDKVGPQPKKPKRNKKKRIVPLFVKILLYVVLVGVGAVGLGYGVWECAQDVMAFGRSEEALTVVVNEGDTVEDIGQMLKEKGVIKYPWLFELYCKFTDIRRVVFQQRLLHYWRNTFTVSHLSYTSNIQNQR